MFEEISSKQITFHLQKGQPGSSPVWMHMDLTVINHKLQKGRTQRRREHPQLRGTMALHEHGGIELAKAQMELKQKRNVRGNNKGLLQLH